MGSPDSTARKHNRLARRRMALAGLGYGLAAWPLLQWCALAFGAGPDAASQAAFVLILAATLALLIAQGRAPTARFTLGAILLPALALFGLRASDPFALCGMPAPCRFLVGLGVCAAFSLPALHVLTTQVRCTPGAVPALAWLPCVFMASAAAGMASAQFVLVPWLGAWGAMAVGAACLVAAEAASWLVKQDGQARPEAETTRVSSPHVSASESAKALTTDGEQRTVASWLVPFLCALMVGCAAALAMRLTRLQAPCTAYSANIAAVWLLLGSAVGWLCGWLLALRPEPGGVVAAGSLFALCLAAAGSVMSAKPMAAFAGEVVASAGGSWPLIVVAISVATAPWGLTCGALGGLAAASATCLAWHPRPGSTRRVRLSLGVPLAGVACGVGVAHRLILDRVGLGPGLIVAASLLLALGIWRLCVLSSVPAKARGLICAAAGVAFLSSLAVSPPSDKKLVSSATSWPSAKSILAAGAAPKSQPLRSAGDSAAKLLFHAVDRHGWIAVAQGHDQTRRLVVDGTEVSSTDKVDATLSAMLALVPAALCSGRECALQLGLRDGAVLAALVSHGFGAVDCVEPRRAMLAATQWLGVRENVVAPGAAVSFMAETPARALATTSRQYDVIVSCPPAHWAWLAGASFCRPYLTLCRKRLTAKGVCATWLPLRRIGHSGLQTALRAFGEVFEHTTAWLAIDHVVIAGSKSRFSLGIESMAARLDSKSLRKRMKQRGTDTAVDAWSRLLMTTSEASVFAGQGPVAGWGSGRVELCAARAMQRDTFTRNLLLTAQYRNALFTRVSTSAAGIAPEPLLTRLAKAFDRASIMIAHHAAIKSREDDEFFGELLMAGKAGPRIAGRPASGPAACKSNGIACFRMGFEMGAYRLLKKALVQDFRDAEVRYYLGAACRRLKKLDEAARHLKRALAANPKLAEAHLEMAQVHLATGKPQKAIDEVLAGLALDQDIRGAHTLLGFIYGQVREYDKATFHFRIALAKDPKDKVAAYNLRLLSPKKTRKGRSQGKGRMPGRTSPSHERPPRQ